MRLGLRSQCSTVAVLAGAATLIYGCGATARSSSSEVPPTSAITPSTLPVAPTSTSPASTSTSIGAQAQGLISAAIGTWTCTPPSSSDSFSVSIRQDGTFGLRFAGNAQSVTADGTWVLDRTGVHIRLAKSKLTLNAVSPLLGSSSALNVTSFRLQGTDAAGNALDQSVQVTRNGLKEISFRALESDPGVRSDTWICRRQ